MNAVITAMGGYVPPDEIGNAQIARQIGKSPAWILDRTGIETRHYAAPDVPTSVLAQHAVEDMARRFPGALQGVSAIIVATSTPDRPQPATAARLQPLIGLSGVPASDLNAVCAGWAFALKQAAALVATEGGKVLVVGADEYSRIVGETNPKTVPIFGDGAGVVTVEWSDEDGTGLLSLELATHGELSNLVTVPAGGSECPVSNDPDQYLFQMLGWEVKRYVLDRLPALLFRACAKARVRLDQIGAFICHQANVRLLEALAKEIGVDFSLFPLTAPLYGNTGAASLPLTLVAAHDAGLLVPGRPVAFGGMGGGMGLAAGIYVP